MLYEVSNRGGKGMLGFYNHATGSLNPSSDAEMGDGFLMKQGFTLLWVGWQFDPPAREGLVRVYAPVATDNGTPIVGIVRSEVIVVAAGVRRFACRSRTRRISGGRPGRSRPIR